jgi:hypothetical protein
MTRFTQPEAKKGSQKWIQKLINQKPKLLNSQIKQSFNLSDNEQIEWLSPKEEDNYVEYDLETFLEKLNEEVEELSLDKFWPKRGPRWDALGRSSSGKLFLVEAKSHISELISTLRAKNPRSKAIIRKSFEDTKKDIGSKADFDWSKTFYQYTNRLAHLNFLRKHSLSAYLVFVYFLNDRQMKGPTSIDEWKGAIELLHTCLGIRRHKLQKYVTELFIDIAALRS